MDSINWEAKGVYNVKEPGSNPTSAIKLLHDWANGVSISTSEKAYLGYEDQMRQFFCWWWCFFFKYYSIPFMRKIPLSGNSLQDTNKRYKRPWSLMFLNDSTMIRITT